MRTKKICYGAGPEYCHELSEDIVELLPTLDVFELIPENFFGGHEQWFIDELRKAGTPVIIHGIELSIGTDGPFKQHHFDQMKKIADQVNLIAMSDHICMTEAGDIKIGQLTTLPFTKRGLDVACDHVEAMSKQVNVPIVLENIANQFYFPHCDYSETEFISELLHRTGSFLLMDLHNIYANSQNFAFDPYQWMTEVPMDRVWAIHLAGGYYDKDQFLEDAHSSPVPEPVWEMLEWLCQRHMPSAVIVERTSDYPGVNEIMAEVKRARKIMDASRLMDQAPLVRSAS